MRMEHLLSWMVASMRKESPKHTLWEKVVGMLQAAFCEVHLLEECTWQTVVLIPKGDG